MIEEGEEVSHHYEDRPGQSKEQFADVKSPLIEIVYSDTRNKIIKSFLRKDRIFQPSEIELQYSSN